MTESALILLADLKNMHLPTQYTPPALKELMLGEEIPMTTGAKMHLFYAIDKFSANECENPRDRVFGLLGVVAKDGRIVIDYSLSTSDVFTKTVVKICEIGILDVNNRHGTRSSGWGLPADAKGRLYCLAKKMGVNTELDQLHRSMRTTCDKYWGTYFYNLTNTGGKGRERKNGVNK